MKRLLIVIFVGVLFLGLLPGEGSAVSQGQTDRALGGSTDVLYCGVSAAVASLAEPWTLDLSATTTSSSSGEVKIVFEDTDFVRYKIPADSSFYITQALGNVPGVDRVVRIEPSGGVSKVLASARVRVAVKDPFDEAGDGGTAKTDNFCVKCAAASTPGDAGCSSGF